MTTAPTRHSFPPPRPSRGSNKVATNDGKNTLAMLHAVAQEELPTPVQHASGAAFRQVIADDCVSQNPDGQVVWIYEPGYRAFARILTRSFDSPGPAAGKSLRILQDQPEHIVFEFKPKPELEQAVSCLKQLLSQIPKLTCICLVVSPDLDSSGCARITKVLAASIAIPVFLICLDVGRSTWNRIADRGIDSVSEVQKRAVDTYMGPARLFASLFTQELKFDNIFFVDADVTDEEIIEGQTRLVNKELHGYSAWIVGECARLIGAISQIPPSSGTERVARMPMPKFILTRRKFILEVASAVQQRIRGDPAAPLIGSAPYFSALSADILALKAVVDQLLTANPVAVRKADFFPAEVAEFYPVDQVFNRPAQSPPEFQRAYQLVSAKDAAEPVAAFRAAVSACGSRAGNLTILQCLSDAAVHIACLGSLYSEAAEILRDCSTVMQMQFPAEILAAGKAMMLLGACLRLDGRLPEAADALRLALDKLANHTQNPIYPAALALLANILCATDQYQEAHAKRRAVYEYHVQTYGERNNNTVQAHLYLAESCSHLNRHQEALAIRQRCLEIRKADLGPTNQLTLLAMEDCGLSLTKLARHQEAASIREEYRSLVRGLVTANPVCLPSTELASHQRILEAQHAASLRGLGNVTKEHRNIKGWSEAIQNLSKTVQLSHLINLLEFLQTADRLIAKQQARSAPPPVAAAIPVPAPAVQLGSAAAMPLPPPLPPTKGSKRLAQSGASPSKRRA